MSHSDPYAAPRVSVITPAYNSAAFLRHTVDSVRRQTIHDWELLVIDDGSTDGSADLVEALAAGDSRIRLLRQQNGGPSTARNHGMRAAQGQFFAFLDSDDWWDPEFLESQLEVFARHPETALVTTNAYFVGGPFDGRPRRPPADGFRVLTLEDILGNESAVFIMTVFRREVFDRIGGLDAAQWTSEDYDFWIRAAVAGFVFRVNPRPLAYYVRREGSLSHNEARMLRGMLHTYDKARTFCPPGSSARLTLERQVDRFERDLLLAEAKQALDRQDFHEAAARLRALRARGAGAAVALTAWLAEHAPPAALLAYRARHLRRTWLTSRYRWGCTCFP